MGERKFRVPVPQGLGLWIPITVLLALGLGTTVVDLTDLPQAETLRATRDHQRLVIDPVSGTILTGSDVTTKKPAEEKFDVGTAAEEAAKPSAPEPAAPAATATAEKTEPPPAAEEAKTEPAATATEEHAAAPAPAAEEAKGTAAHEPAPAKEATPANAQPLRTEALTADINAPIHTKDSLVIAPAPEITETVDGLPLPKRGGKGVTAAQLYAHPFTRKSDQVLISFVVMDAGLDPQAIGLLMNLPQEVTIAYSPYTRKNASYSENMRAAGHEVWTMLPVMGERYPSDDPGPLGLIAKMPKEEIVRRQREVLAAIPGSVGLVLPPNETISTQRDTLAPALTEIDARGLLVLSTHPSRNIDQLTSDKKLAEIIHRADLVLDPVPNEPQIKSKLAGLLAAAKEKGEYVVVLSARLQTLQILGEWLHDAPMTAPYTLAPLSALYQAKEAAEPKPEEGAEGGHGGGHGGGEKKEKPKPPPKAKVKVLPQDQYKQPPAGEKGGHGGGEKKPEGGH